MKPAPQNKVDGLARTSTCAILAAATIPLVVLFSLRIADVPIGRPGYVVYRYSPLWDVRLEHALIALMIGAIGLLSLSRLFSREFVPRRGINFALPFVAAILVHVALVVWAFVAPPRSVDQHSFNMLSPSHEGAFVIEGRGVSSIRDYVSREYFERLQKPPEHMRGRRVLSNPPGMTVASILVERFVQGSPALRTRLISWFELHDLDDDPVQQTQFAAALLLALILNLAWGLSLWPGYLLARLWLKPLPAIALAFAMIWNPAAVNFTPGKDPAQLLTVLAGMYCWMVGHQRRNRRWSLVAGAVAAASAMVGLIHVWIFGILIGATLWHHLASDGGIRVWLSRTAFPAILGGICVIALALVALDWNILKTALLLGIRYGQIQEEIIPRPIWWILPGFPMFLLFVGPMFWSLAATMRRDTSDAPASLGARLLICTTVVMTYSYFFANNNETPRLWMPFIPLLLLGLALRRSTMRGVDGTSRRLHLFVLALQLSVTVLHWSLMDVRESEWRLTTGRMWD